MVSHRYTALRSDSLKLADDAFVNIKISNKRFIHGPARAKARSLPTAKQDQDFQLGVYRQRIKVSTSPILGDLQADPRRICCHWGAALLSLIISVFHGGWTIEHRSSIDG